HHHYLVRCFAPRAWTALSIAVLSVALLATMPATYAAHANGGLIANDAAQRYGLERAWFSQVQLDPSRHTVENAVLYNGQIVVLTTAGVLHVMDAETGSTIWMQRMGNPDF